MQNWGGTRWHGLSWRGGWCQRKGRVFIFFVPVLHACVLYCVCLWTCAYTFFVYVWMHRQGWVHVYVKVDLSIMLDCSSTSLAEVGSLNHAQGLPVWPMSIASLHWGLEGEFIWPHCPYLYRMWDRAGGLAVTPPSAVSSLSKQLTVVTCIALRIISFWSSLMSSLNPKKMYTSASGTTLL